MLSDPKSHHSRPRECIVKCGPNIVNNGVFASSVIFIKNSLFADTPLPLAGGGARSCWRVSGPMYVDKTQVVQSDGTEGVLKMQFPDEKNDKKPMTVGRSHGLDSHAVI